MNSTITTQETLIMPPTPPINGNDFIRGEFEYVSSWDRPYIKDAYQVITRTELWAPFRVALQSRGVDRETGFQFSNDPLYNVIMNAVASTDIGGGHSGYTMGATMRVMQTIALYGEAEYRRQCLEYQANQEQIQRQAAERPRVIELTELQINGEENISTMTEETSRALTRLLASMATDNNTTKV
jgi:hypothetical protein